MADTMKQLQKLMDKLNETCKIYGMGINVTKTKVMVMCKKGQVKCCVSLDGILLEQVGRYKYLGSWISEDAKCEEEVRARIGGRAWDPSRVVQSREWSDGILPRAKGEKESASQPGQPA